VPYIQIEILELQTTLLRSALLIQVCTTNGFEPIVSFCVESRRVARARAGEESTLE
jgi:hypothetical protein